uniref:Uncharacterized protein n=1 Tax=Sparus aurata TaxID=8175 RepID=A0A671TL40_SPAAU
RILTQDGHLAQVEVNEMLCLVGDVAAKVPPDDAVPAPLGSIPCVLSHLLDVRCDVLLYVVLLHGLRGTVHRVLLHVLGHVRDDDGRLLGEGGRSTVTHHTAPH